MAATSSIGEELRLISFPIDEFIFLSQSVTFKEVSKTMADLQSKIAKFATQVDIKSFIHIGILSDHNVMGSVALPPTEDLPPQIPPGHRFFFNKAFLSPRENEDIRESPISFSLKEESALAIKLLDKISAIYSSMPKDVVDFGIAHEIGHCLLAEKFNINSVIARGKLSIEQQKLLENICDCVAAALTSPNSGIAFFNILSELSGGVLKQLKESIKSSEVEEIEVEEIKAHHPSYEERIETCEKLKQDPSFPPSTAAEFTSFIQQIGRNPFKEIIAIFENEL